MTCWMRANQIVSLLRQPAGPVVYVQKTQLIMFRGSSRGSHENPSSIFFPGVCIPHVSGTTGVEDSSPRALPYMKHTMSGIESLEREPSASNFLSTSSSVVPSLRYSFMTNSRVTIESEKLGTQKGYRGACITWEISSDS